MVSNIYLLVICPYVGMKEVVKEVISQQENVYADIYEADLQEAIHLVRGLNLMRYDAIVSRGGTADMLKEEVNIPVFDMGLSGMDVLRAIRLAQKFNQDFVVCGFDTITKQAQMLNEVLQLEIPVYTIDSAKESLKVLTELKKEGIQVVVCDVIGSKNALKLNQNPVLISSGYNTINTAIENAVYYSRRFLRNRISMTLMTQSHQMSPYPCVIFDREKQVYFSGLSEGQGSILNYLKEHIEEWDQDREISTERMIRNRVVNITSKKLYVRGESFLYLFLQITEQQETRKIDAIRIINGQESLHVDHNYYYSSHMVGSGVNVLEKYGKTLSPVVITGEQGTGKDQAAILLYGFSEYKNSIFYQIDCDKMTERNWNYLLSSHESLLAYKKRTIYIKHLEAMPANIFGRFMAYVVDSELHKRNRLIISCTVQKGEKNLTHPYLMEVMEHISCLSVYLPSLMERLEDIPVLSTYYINRLNTELGKQIIGFDRKAMEAMKLFPWESNLSQLKRIIHELMLITSGSYISYESTMRVLRKETSVWSNPDMSKSFGLDLNQSLEEINYDVIRYVLKEENNNHTSTAKRLGISRSTLWRILKQHVEE